MVTAEAAVATLALVVVLAAALWALSVAVAQVRVVDAAGVGARSAARGDSDARVLEVARRSAPDGASVSVSRDGGAVRVDVARAVHAPGVLGRVGVTVRGHAVVADEASTP